MARGGVVTFVAAGLVGAAAAGLSAPAPAAASELDRRVQIGDPVEDVELSTLDGRRERLLARNVKVNVFVFFRPQQERSLDTLTELAGCEREFAGKPVRFVGVVSDSWPADEVRELVARSGVSMPVLVDAGDALYAKLGIRMHPVIGIVDAKRTLAAFEPFRQINYCERVKVRIRHALGEVSAAEVTKVDEPERATTRTEAGVARRHLNFARMLHRIQKEDEALAEVRKSEALAPSADALALEGEILAGMGRCAEALRAFDAAAELEPGHAAAREGRKRCAP